MLAFPDNKAYEREFFSDALLMTELHIMFIKWFWARHENPLRVLYKKVGKMVLVIRSVLQVTVIAFKLDTDQLVGDIIMTSCNYIHCFIMYISKQFMLSSNVQDMKFYLQQNLSWSLNFD
jgi:hypothetical protein